MFFIVIDLHPNILSAQCYMKYEIQKSSANNMQIIGTHDSLLISLCNDDELQKEIKILLPENFFLPTSISKGENATCLIELAKESFKITQKSHYSKYRKVIERHLEAIQSENSTITANHYKRLKINNSEIMIHNEEIEPYEIGEIDYSEHCSPVEDIILLNFRVQISGSEVIPETGSHLSSYCSFYNFLKANMQMNELYEAVCSNCSTMISTVPVQFKDIKEFSFSFSDLSENWFCHKSIKPCYDISEKVLYVGDSYTYLDMSVVQTLLLEEHNSEMSCQKCQTLLAYQTIALNDNKQLKCFFADTVIWKKAQTNDLVNFKVAFEFYSKTVMLLLLTLINQKSLPICRLFLQSKVEGNKDMCLLLWIPISEVAQFKFQSSTENLPSEVNFSSKPVYKVQYYVGTLDSPLVQSWSKNFGVDFYKVSEKLMNTLVNDLKSSSEYIPGQRTDNHDFCNGCIPTSITF